MDIEKKFCTLHKKLFVLCSKIAEAFIKILQKFTDKKQICKIKNAFKIFVFIKKLFRNFLF